MFSGKPFSCTVSLAILVLLLGLLAVTTSGVETGFSGNAISGLIGDVKKAEHEANWPSVKTESLDSEGENSSLILAAARTRRKDPLENLRYYTGGWNISDKHYFASAGFTAAPLLVVAAIWFIATGLCLLLTCLCFCCCRGSDYGYSRTAYALSLILLSVFTIGAIIGSIVLYTGQGEFHNSSSKMLDYVVGQSDSTVDNLRNVSDYLLAAKGIQVDNIFLPTDLQKSIDQVDGKIKSAADTLETETANNKQHIVDILDTVRKILIVISAVMLVVALLGFFFSVLGWQGLVHILVFFGWILVAATFILSGVFLALYNVTGDTCVAMDQWVKNPTAHTALDDILPCVDASTAQETLSQSKNVTSQMVGVVDGIITNVANRDIPPSAGPLYYNQTGPSVPILCNPFNPDNTDRKCAAGEVELANATQVWKDYVCQVSGSNCTTVGRLTPNMYEQMSSAVNVSYGLYHYGPFLTDLLDCTFVRDTFTTIKRDHCAELQRFSKWVHIGLALVASAVALSLIFWVVYARERRHRRYTKLADARSLQQDSIEMKGQSAN